MSNRDKCIAILDSFNDTQLADIAAMLQAAKNAIDDALDDAFCISLYQRYLKDPDKGQGIPIEEAAAILGVDL